MTVIAVVAAAIPLAVMDPFSNDTPSNSLDDAVATGTYTIARQDLASEIPVTGTLGYAGSYTVVNRAGGASATSGSSQAGTSEGSATFTSLPSVGQVVSEGQVLYEVNGAPVVLLNGSTPAYRSLSEGMSGVDVTELNADLVALGKATSTELSPTSDYFSAETAFALEKLQATLGVTESGTLALGQAVFLPAAARVTSVSATLGGPAQTGMAMLTATSTSRQVSIPLDASLQSDVAVGEDVSIVLPNNQTTPGVISAVGTVATSSTSASSSGGSSGSGSSPPTVTEIVTPTDPAATGTWDEAPIKITITTQRVKEALAVPIDALLAPVGGGYDVEVVRVGGLHHLVPVSLGLFDDAAGLVQVTGSTLKPGTRIVVPKL